MKRPPDGRGLRIDGETIRYLSFAGERTVVIDALTEAERDVVAHVLRGCSNVEIARARGTSARTVANQLASIYEKLGVRDRRELICLATDSVRRGVAETGEET